MYVRSPLLDFGPFFMAQIHMYAHYSRMYLVAGDRSGGRTLLYRM